MLCVMTNDRLGARIRQAYELAGLNRHQFALKLGTGYANVCKWEAGTTAPKGDYLARIADITGTSTDWLLGREDPPPSVEPSAEFSLWLTTMAPKDLTPEERRELASVQFTQGRHPGPIFYQVALSVIRAGRSAQDAQQAHDETMAHRARAEARKKGVELPTPRPSGRKKH